jgi:hypothetical protein
MKKKHLIMLLAIIVLVLAGGLVGCKKTDDKSLESQTYSTEAASVEETVVGVYDSRAIALAYWQQEVDGKQRMYRHEDLGMKAIDLGVLMHQQVFSYHKPVQSLEYIADKLPGVMEQASVDVIVSKWDKEELAKYNVIGSGWDGEFAVNNPNVVDVTIGLVQLYNPKATLQEYKEGLGKSLPEPLDTDWLHAEE